MEISSREELLKIMADNKQGRKTVNQKVCSICGEKSYRIFVKGVERWMACGCNKGTPYKKRIPHRIIKIKDGVHIESFGGKGGK